MEPHVRADYPQNAEVVIRYTAFCDCSLLPDPGGCRRRPRMRAPRRRQARSRARCRDPDDPDGAHTRRSTPQQRARPPPGM